MNKPSWRVAWWTGGVGLVIAAIVGVVALVIGNLPLPGHSGRPFINIHDGTWQQAIAAWKEIDNIENEVDRTDKLRQWQARYPGLTVFLRTAEQDQRFREDSKEFAVITSIQKKERRSARLKEWLIKHPDFTNKLREIIHEGIQEWDRTKPPEPGP